MLKISSKVDHEKYAHIGKKIGKDTLFCEATEQGEVLAWCAFIYENTSLLVISELWYSDKSALEGVVRYVLNSANSLEIEMVRFQQNCINILTDLNIFNIKFAGNYNISNMLNLNKNCKNNSNIL